MSVDYEAILRKVYEAVLKNGDVAIDVGAHTGTHSLPMAVAVGKEGKVYAVEPLPFCCQALKNNVSPELMDTLEAFDFALGAEDEKTEFVVAVDAPAYSGLQKRTYDVPTSLKRIPIQVWKMDTAFSHLGAIAYIKIDAEGGEYHILKGAEQCIEKHRPLISFEFGVNSISEYQITPRDMADFWSSRQYKVYDILGRLIENEDMFVSSAEMQHVWDYICVPIEKPDLARIMHEWRKG